MKVFLSWSGEKSRQIAELLREWLPDVVNAVEPWMSSEDIDKGAAGLPAIAAQLSESRFGIVCLTRDNQDRAWINYEAGALSKSVGDDPSRVATLLVDFCSPSDVTGPLSQFQATRLELGDMIRLAQSLNRLLDAPRTGESVARVVQGLWPAFEERVGGVLAQPGMDSDEEVRSDRDVLDELLALTRSLARDRAQSSRAARIVARAQEIVRHHIPDAEGVSIEETARGRWEVTVTNADVLKVTEALLSQDLEALLGERPRMILIPF